MRNSPIRIGIFADRLIGNRLTRMIPIVQLFTGFRASMKLTDT